jgi:hypothetical protein
MRLQESPSEKTQQIPVNGPLVHFIDDEVGVIPK